MLAGVEQYTQSDAIQLTRGIIQRCARSGRQGSKGTGGSHARASWAAGLACWPACAEQPGMKVRPGGERCESTQGGRGVKEMGVRHKRGARKRVVRATGAGEEAGRNKSNQAGRGRSKSGRGKKVAREKAWHGMQKGGSVAWYAKRGERGSGGGRGPEGKISGRGGWDGCGCWGRRRGDGWKACSQIRLVLVGGFGLL